MWSARSRAAELSEVRRFSDPWEAKASLRLRAGDSSVLDEYDARGRIVGGDRDEMVEEAFSTWLAARRAGESVIVVAPDHAMVDALALRARAVTIQNSQHPRAVPFRPTSLWLPPGEGGQPCPRP